MWSWASATRRSARRGWWTTSGANSSARRPFGASTRTPSASLRATDAAPGRRVATAPTTPTLSTSVRAPPSAPGCGWPMPAARWWRSRPSPGRAARAAAPERPLAEGAGRHGGVVGPGTVREIGGAECGAPAVPAPRKLLCHLTGRLGGRRRRACLGHLDPPRDRLAARTASLAVYHTQGHPADIERLYPRMRRVPAADAAGAAVLLATGGPAGAGPAPAAGASCSNLDRRPCHPRRGGCGASCTPSSPRTRAGRIWRMKAMPARSSSAARRNTPCDWTAAGMGCSGAWRTRPLLPLDGRSLATRAYVAQCRIGAGRLLAKTLRVGGWHGDATVLPGGQRGRPTTVRRAGARGLRRRIGGGSLGAKGRDASAPEDATRARVRLRHAHGTGSRHGGRFCPGAGRAPPRPVCPRPPCPHPNTAQPRQHVPEGAARAARAHCGPRDRAHAAPTCGHGVGPFRNTLFTVSGYLAGQTPTTARE